MYVWGQIEVLVLATFLPNRKGMLIDTAEGRMLLKQNPLTFQATQHE